MKKAVLILSLLALVSAKEEVKKVKAGVITSFKQDFLNDYKDAFNEKFI
jgi:hypothetical protein